jgi:hypothetical protein
MRQRQYVNALRQFLINQLVGKSGDAASADGRDKKGKSVRLLLNGVLSRPISAEKITSQFRSLALVVFCGGGEFDIGFAMENQRLHPMAA